MRFVFVRDGFSFWAFLLTSLWMLRHRLWLVLLGYVVVATALQVGVHLLDASATVMFAVGFLLSLLVGFEAATLRRFTLGRRGWTNVGIVVGDDVELAERRFFDSWVRATPARRRRRRPLAAAPRRRRLRRHRAVPRAGSAALTVAIVDYGSGNLHSAAKAFERAAREARSSSRSW